MNHLSKSPVLISIIANISYSLELLAVAVITFSILYAVVINIRNYFQHRDMETSLNSFKQIFGRAVQVALELLIAGDIINTVLLDATIQNVIVLGLLVLIRTFLSWTLMIETEGHLPWNKKINSN
jgi:uncharacterized membrane protein